MKYFLTLVFLFVGVCASDDWLAKTNNEIIVSRIRCSKNLNISLNEFTIYNKWNLPNTSLFRSYAKCLVNDTGIFDDTTGFNIERVIKQYRYFPDPDPISDDDLKAIVTKCAVTNDIYAPDVWVYTGLNCFLREAQKLEDKKIN